jgi:dihydrofolate synthase/folylpolyglutamate synthase
MSLSSLPDWLARIESLHPVKWDLGLARVTRVAEVMQVLHPVGTVFLVAGTNGKGSTIAMMDAILRAQGLRTGVATSPHLLRFNERICLDGEPVSDQLICDSFARIDSLRGDTSLTYFEFASLAALDIFYASEPQAILLEIGLGGRLDAMNMITPDLSIITSIALDHQDWLGADRETIGAEKAGIMRARKPVILGPDMPGSVWQTAQTQQALVSSIGSEFRAETGRDHWNFIGHNSCGEKIQISNLPYNQLPLDNAVIAVQALLSSGLSIGQEAIKQGLASTRIAGRYQVVEGPVPIVLDVAHNPHAAEYLARRLGDDQVSGRTHGVVAMYADKDCESVFAAMGSVVDRWYLCGMAEARGESAMNLARRLPTQERNGSQTCDRVASALNMARASATAGDRIVVFGSFPAVAEALALLETGSIEGGK